GVLELVHEDVAETAPIVREQSSVVAPQLVRAQQQLGEVHNAGAGASLFVVRIELDELTTRRIVVVLEAARPPPFILVRIDEPLHLARHPAALVQVASLDQLLDQTLLILGVEDLESLHEARFAPVQPQQPMRQAMEGANPERAPGYPQQRLDAAP